MTVLFSKPRKNAFAFIAVAQVVGILSTYSEPMSLQQAMDKGFQHHPRILQACLQRAQADLRAEQTQVPFQWSCQPFVDCGLGGSEGKKDGSKGDFGFHLHRLFPWGTSFRVEPRLQYNEGGIASKVHFTLSHPLFGDPVVARQVFQAKFSRLQQHQQQDRVMVAYAAVALDFLRLVIPLQVAQEQRLLCIEREKRIRGLVEAVRLLSKAKGKESKELETLCVFKEKLEGADRQVEHCKRRLRDFLALPDEQEWQTTFALEPLYVQTSLEQAWQLAERNRFELIHGRNVQQLYAHEWAKETRWMKPCVRVVADYQSEGNDPLFGWHPYNQTLGHWGIGLSGSLPFSSEASHRLAGSSLDKRQADLALRETERQVREEVRGAWHRLQEGYVVMNREAEKRDQARLRERVARLKYQAGKLSLHRLLEHCLTAFTAEQRYLQVLGEVIVVEQELHYAMGSWLGNRGEECA